MNTTTIDSLDYAVLAGVHGNGKSWKKRVHRWIVKNIDELPLDEPKSVQTTGRRIDDLQDAGLLDACIMSPETVNREMIIGYTLTADGKQALEAARNELLRELVVESSKDLLTGNDYGVDADPADREMLVHLLTTAFDIDDETQDAVVPRIETGELLGLLAAHFFLDNTDGTFTPEHEDAMVAFLEQTPQFCRPFEKENAIARIRQKIGNRHDDG